MRKRLLALALTMGLLCSGISPAAALTLDEARELLEDYYVDEIPEKVLEKDSLEEILEALDDPYTVYYTAEEYADFLAGVNGESVVGIGVSVQTAFDGGFQLLSVLPGSPALEAGLEAGDRITAVDGRELTATSDIRSAIAGEEGSQVTVTILRLDGTVRDFTLTRRAVDIPIVTCEAEDGVGWINNTSFGETTAQTIGEALETMDEEVDVWVMDLRSNPGGTSSAATSTIGLFMGGGVTAFFRGADGRTNLTGNNDRCPDLTDKPLILLTSGYSASGSELFAGAARDCGFGVAVGQRTYGKGIAQVVFDEGNTVEGVFNGDALKVTRFRFYSPDGTANQTVGVLPTLLISPYNTGVAASLLAHGEPDTSRGWLRLELAGFSFYLNEAELRLPEYLTATAELLSALPPSAVLSRGTGGTGWAPADPAALAREYTLIEYAPRAFSDLNGARFADEINTLAAYNIVSGDGSGMFRPDRQITRAEFCAMAASALNLTPSAKAPAFTDVPAGAWYAGAVAAVAGKGLMTGYENGSFHPNDSITYEELVTVLGSAAAWLNMYAQDAARKGIPASDYIRYCDFSAWAQVPAYALDTVDSLVGGLDPADRVTRDVAAGMLCTLMENTHLIWN